MATSSIYIGAWLNHSKGLFYSPTLTTTAQQGLLLVAFLVLFVYSLTNRLWAITRYSIHQSRSTRSPQDGLYHQKQLILRTSSSPAAAAWHLIRLGFAWRSRADRPLRRVLPLATLAAAHSIFFLVAALIASSTFDPSDQVLVRSPYCGYLTYPDVADADYSTTDYAQLNAAFHEQRTAAQWSNSYARDCYGDSSGADCDFFAVPSIESSATVVACPFDDSMCLDAEMGALMLDSGVLNTNDLGINAPTGFSLGYRRVTTCAPLVTDAFSAWYDGNSNALTGDKFLDFSYGDYVNEAANVTMAITWAYDLYSANTTSSAYAMNYAYSALGNRTASSFSPITKLNRTDADVTLLFITNNAVYPNPVSDLLYNASLATNDTYGFPTAYTASSPVAVMGCTEQHQICTTSHSSSCSSLTGLYDLPRATTSEAQRSIASDLLAALFASQLNEMAGSLGSDALLASLSINGANTRLSAGLSDAQWQNEIASWHAYSLAHTQRLLVNVAAGPTDAAFTPYISPISPNNTAAWDVCTNTKIRASASHYSFNLTGLFLIISTGTLIILASYLLPALTSLARSRSSTTHADDRTEDWHLDAPLQLHRLAYEGAKLGAWDASTPSGVPVTHGAPGTILFGKPGRVVKAYEPLELTDQWATTTTMTMEGGAEPPMAMAALTQSPRKVRGLLRGFGGGRSDAGGAAGMMKKNTSSLVAAREVPVSDAAEEAEDEDDENEDEGVQADPFADTPPPSHAPPPPATMTNPPPKSPTSSLPKTPSSNSQSQRQSPNSDPRPNRFGDVGVTAPPAYTYRYEVGDDGVSLMGGGMGGEMGGGAVSMFGRGSGLGSSGLGVGAGGGGGKGRGRGRGGSGGSASVVGRGAARGGDIGVREFV